MIMPGTLVLLLFLAVPEAALTPEQQHALLSEANTAFDRALVQQDKAQADIFYQQAIGAYERLLTAGIQNGKLYYNLGNAYFRRNDLGRAIAAYRQGLQLEPGNTRLQANLQYARNLRIDHFEGAQERSLLETLFFWQSTLRLSTRVALAASGFWIAWGCAVLLRFWRQAVLHWLLGGAVLGCGLFAASAFLTHWQHSTIRHGVIVASEAAWRKGNGESYALQLSEPLHAGTEFVVLEERGAWLHGQLVNGVSGWIRQEEVVVW